MKHLPFAASLCVAVCLALPGCAAPRVTAQSKGTGFEFRDPSMTPARAAEAVVPGQSTKADITALLGPATVIRFDSGYEVWAWRVKARSGSDARTEFVVLFDGAGIARKTRLREPVAARAS